MATRQREKAAKIESQRDKRPTAIACDIRIPSGKVEIVLDLIRGKSLNDALAVLNNTNKAACDVILKVVNSAAANAENNLNLVRDNLYVAQCWATPGRTMKRMMPRARGRADRILKHSCHIRVILDEKPTATTETPKAKVKEAKTVTTKTTSKTATPKPVPTTRAERPLTKEPNAKKPLGAKKDLVASKAPAKASPKNAGTGKANKEAGK